MVCDRALFFSTTPTGSTQYPRPDEGDWAKQGRAPFGLGGPASFGAGSQRSEVSCRRPVPCPRDLKTYTEAHFLGFSGDLASRLKKKEGLVQRHNGDPKWTC